MRRRSLPSCDLPDVGLLSQVLYSNHAQPFSQAEGPHALPNPQPNPYTMYGEGRLQDGASAAQRAGRQGLCLLPEREGSCSMKGQAFSLLEASPYPRGGGALCLLSRQTRQRTQAFPFLPLLHPL